MPPRNQQPPLEPGEEPLPVMDNGMTLEQLQAINGTNVTRDDLLSAGYTPQQIDEYLNAQSSGAAPAAVAQDVAQKEPEVRRAEPARPRGQTGSRIDLSFINRLNDPNLSEEQAAAEYQKLPPALRYVYDRAADFSYNNQGSQTPAQLDPRDAAGWLDEFYQMQSEQEKTARSPQAKAVEIAQADKAQKTAEMASDIVSLMDRLRGYKKGEKGSEKKTPKYFGRVGTFDSFMPAGTSGDRAGWYIDHDTLESTLALAEAQANRGQGNFTETERAMLRSAATGGLNYRRDDKSYAEIFEGMYDMFKRKAEQQQTPRASTPSSMPSFTVGEKLTDKFGNVRIFRGMDQSGKPILDPVQ